MKYIGLGLALVIILPFSAHAATFAKQSLFLSKTPVTEGDTVLIHAVVANDGTAKFDGDVVFKDADTKIGSVAVSIAQGGANAVSVSWKPAAGSHNITAELTASGGAVVESESATFLINEKPKPASVEPAAPTPVGILGAYPEQHRAILPRRGKYRGARFLDARLGARERGQGSGPRHRLGEAKFALESGQGARRLKPERQRRRHCDEYFRDDYPLYTHDAALRDRERGDLLSGVRDHFLLYSVADV